MPTTHKAPNFILSPNLFLFNIRAADDILDRQFTIELSSGKNRLYLQAFSKDLQDQWIHHITNHINPPHVINPTPPTSPAITKKLSGPSDVPKNPEDTSTNPLNRKPSIKINTQPIPQLQTLHEKRNNDIKADLSLQQSENSNQNQANSSENNKNQKKNELLHDIITTSKSTNLETKNTKISPLFQLPGNAICADCGKSEPRWCSINLGIILCIDCSGVHRSLGVHISKVRSLTLDALSNDISDLMFTLGNDMINKIYLSGREQKFHIIKTTSERQAIIREKYVNKIWVQLENLLKPDFDYFGFYDNRQVSVFSYNTIPGNLEDFEISSKNYEKLLRFGGFLVAPVDS